MTPEGKVKNDVKKWLTSIGVWFAGKPAPTVVTGWMYMPVSNGMGVSGIPDFCGIFMGKPLFIETKAPGKASETTENQKMRHREIHAAGGVVLVVTSVAELKMGLLAHGYDVY